MSAKRPGWLSRRAILVTLTLSAALVLFAHPLAAASSDVFGNVAPASQLPAGGLAERYPLGNYALDEHFTAVSAGVFSGVDVSGVPPMIAYFLAEVLWQLTAFLASALITLFTFAFSLDLVNGSSATGGAGALAPVSAAIHSIYANVFGQAWLVVAVAVVGIWAMWKALVQRRYSETAGALGLSLIYLVVALFFVAEPAQTIGAASRWTNEMSGAFLSISDRGSISGAQQAKLDGADQLFSLLVFKPWTVLEFGGTEHCVKDGTGSSESDPESVAVRPLSSNPARDAALSRRLEDGTQVGAEGKTCVNNANKYAPHFLRFAPGSSERNSEYSALNDGNASELPDADPGKANSSYRLGAADKPAAEAMGEGGQYQRLLVAIVVFVAELGAFCLLGALSVGVILAQVLLLLLLAFAPVALVAAVIPGRGHDFFKGWLTKLAGFLLRKAAYSLILAILLAVNAALAAATSELGWLLSFGLQALFFWAVFVQRKSLTESLVGIATGPAAPGRDGAARVLALYYGARVGSRQVRAGGRALRGRLRGAAHPDPHRGRPASGAAPRPGTDGEAAVGSEASTALAAQRRGGESSGSRSTPPARDKGHRSGEAPARQGRPGTSVSAAPPLEGSAPTRPGPRASGPGSASPSRPSAPSSAPRPTTQPPTAQETGGSGESPLSAELRAERGRAGSASGDRDRRPGSKATQPKKAARSKPRPAAPSPPPQRPKRRGGKR